MNNYHYLISSLPLLTPSWGKDSASPDSLRKEIYDNISDKDRKLMRWIEYSADSSKLGVHLYARALRHKNPFIREYMRFDLNLRNAKVRYLNKSLGRDEMKDVLPLDGGVFEEEEAVQAALRTANILEREEKLDAIVWNKVDEMTLYDYFNSRTVMAVLVKLNIIDRWYKLDPDKGAQLFKELVNEVRGTFKGLNPDDYTKAGTRK